MGLDPPTLGAAGKVAAGTGRPGKVAAGKAGKVAAGKAGKVAAGKAGQVAAGRAGKVASDTPGAGSRAELETRNEVLLVGRVAAPAEERTLPSGDVISTWRLVVERPRGARVVPEGVRVSTVDTLNCVAWGTAPRRVVRGLVAGDVVQVVGALRRRFWRAGSVAVSRCEVEVATVERLARAGP